MIEVVRHETFPQRLHAVYLCLGAVSAVIAGPFPPDGAAEVFRCAQRLVSHDRTSRRELPRLGVLAGGMTVGASVCDGAVAPALVTGSVCRDRADLHISGDLVKEPGQHGCVTDIVPGDLDGPDLLRLFVDPDVDFAPQTAFRAAVLAGVPLAFTLCLDAGAVAQQVQRPLRALIRRGHGQGLLVPAQSAEIRHRPLEAD